MRLPAFKPINVPPSISETVTSRHNLKTKACLYEVLTALVLDYSDSGDWKEL